MKTSLMTLVMSLNFVCYAQAQVQTRSFPVEDAEETIEIERSRLVHTLNVELNRQTVRCLEGDYGASSLKISIPEMRSRTVFPHTTRGEVQPCINAGACRFPFDDSPTSPGLDPGMILDDAKPTENIKLTVVLTEVLDINHPFKTCTRRLRETVNSTVRGLHFAHVDGADLGSLDFAVCLKMKEAAKP